MVIYFENNQKESHTFYDIIKTCDHFLKQDFWYFILIFVIKIMDTFQI